MPLVDPGSENDTVCRVFGLTSANLRHILRLFRLGRRPSVTVYESIGDHFFLAPAPGWLNLGWWEGEGDETEAAIAPERLVERVAGPLPRAGAILDVANGLGAQDPVIARVAEPRLLVAVNLSGYQLRAGRARLDSAGALPVLADAVRLPFAGASFDGLICVEAAFHFPSRAAFFSEALRVLRPGGVLTMSDVTLERLPRTIGDAAAGLVQLRVWGMRTTQVASAGRIAAMAEAAGFVDVRVEMCAARTIDPALRMAEGRLASPGDVPPAHVWGARIGIRGVERLRRSGLIQYALLTASVPAR
jgi:SAM-dependent methyltransferase